MSLHDLSRDAVLRALEEFDQLGRDRFLEKYGFGRATSYFIEYDGSRYDSKAIAGAAHAYVKPEIGPLAPSDFSGGEATVKRRLEGIGFTVASIHQRNPNWTRDELILALDFYLRHRNQQPGKHSAEIVSLSEEISATAQKLGLTGSANFRNPAGVYMKLMNFRRLDPSYTEGGKVGLTRGAKGDEAVWRQFANTPDRLRRVSDIIRACLTDTALAAEIVDHDDDTAEAPEGRVLTRLHRSRERSRKLVLAKKRAFKRQHGRVRCEACAFDFEDFYGPRGSDFIECHHTKPVSTLAPGEKTRIEDLVLLCANCHRIVHAKSEWLSMVELRSIIRAQADNSPPTLSRAD